MDKRNFEKGFSLTELMVATAVFVMLCVVFYPIIHVSQVGSVKFEANFQIKSEAQKAIVEVSHKLVQAKRLFGNNANDLTFFNKVDLTGQLFSPVWNVLPTIEINEVPGNAYPQASVGNSLFFLSLVRSEDLDLVDEEDLHFKLRVDVYRFYYYYLALGDKVVGNKTNRILYKWESKDYVDFSQVSALSSLGPAHRRQVAITALSDRGITHALDVTQKLAVNAFYLINADPFVRAMEPAAVPYMIERRSGGPVITVLTGITTGGYRYGISPNTNPANNPRHPVPLYANGVPGGDFPSGFETLICGISANRQVLMRLVLAAESTSVSAITVEQAQLTTVRDVW